MTNQETEQIDEATRAWREERYRSGDRFLRHYLKFAKEHKEIDLLHAEHDALMRSFEKSTDLGMNEAQVSLWQNVGDYLWIQGYWEELQIWMDQALQASVQLGNLAEQAQLFREFGWQHVMRGNYHEAEQFYQKAFDLYQDIDDLHGESILYRYWGILAFRTGKTWASTRCFNAAYDIAVANGFSGMIPELKLLLGNIEKKYGRLRRARMLHNEACALYKQAGDRNLLIGALLSSGKLELLLGRPDIALGLIQEGLQLADDLKRKDMLCGCWLALAEIQWKGGDRETAHSTALKAYDGYRDLEMGPDMARAAMLLKAIEGNLFAQLRVRLKPTLNIINSLRVRFNTQLAKLRRSGPLPCERRRQIIRSQP